MKAILRNRDVRRLLLATALATLGDNALWLALGIWVRNLTGSNAAAGMVFFAFALPSVFAPLAGVVVDRSSKRRVLRVVNAATLLCVCALFAVHGRADVWVIYLVVLGQGVAYSFMNSASSALLRSLLPDDDLPAANGVRQTANELMRLLAPLAGAGLFALVGPDAVIAFQIGAYVAAALVLMRLRAQGPAIDRGRADWRVELAAGVRHVVATRPLRQMVAAIAAVLLVVGFFETVTFALVTGGLHRSASFTGVVFAAQGAFAVPGGLSAGWGVRRFGELRAAAAGMGMLAVGSLLCVVAEVPVVLAGVACIGLGVPWIVVAFFTAVQRWTPAALQGRVFSAADTMISTPQTCSIAFGAALSTVVSYRAMLVSVATVVALSAAYLATRRASRLPDAEQPATLAALAHLPSPSNAGASAGSG